mgnify:FL=1
MEDKKRKNERKKLQIFKNCTPNHAKKRPLFHKLQTKKEKNKERNTYTFEEVFIIMIISLVIGFFTCFSLNKILSGGKNYRLLSKDLNKFVDAYQTILKNYPDKLDTSKLVESAIEGMMSSIGDKYTTYNDVDGATTFNETVSGTYEGIGCLVTTTENSIQIIEVFDDSPASKAGLKEKDIIKKIDGQDFSDKTSSDMANYIKESDKKEIKITIQRDSEEKEVKLKRQKLEVPTVTTKIYENNDKKIGYIDISIFSSVTDKQFKEKLKELEKKEIDGLIIDVRDNNGGYLNVVTNIASSLLKKGDIIYKLEKSNKKVETKKDTTKEKRTYPIAVLVNAGSASASEILASAIKESYKGFVVGTNTYGKGTVQQTMNLEDGSMIKYTIENWLTPNGNWINEVGVTPTNVVELDEIYYQKPISENDNQLQEAINLVSNQQK